VLTEVAFLTCRGGSSRVHEGLVEKFADRIWRIQLVTVRSSISTWYVRSM